MEREFWEKMAVTLALWNVVFMAALGAIAVGVALLFGKQLPPQIPLFYSRPWGEEQLAPPIRLLIPVLFALATGFVMRIMAAAVKQETVLAAMMLATSLAVQIIIALGLLRIIILVT